MVPPEPFCYARTRFARLSQNFKLLKILYAGMILLGFRKKTDYRGESVRIFASFDFRKKKHLRTRCKRNKHITTQSIPSCQHKSLFDSSHDEFVAIMTIIRNATINIS